MTYFYILLESGFSLFLIYIHRVFRHEVSNVTLDKQL
jgi:hypothetical protein